MKRNKEKIPNKIGSNGEDANLQQTNRAYNSSIPSTSERKKDHSFLGSGEVGRDLNIPAILELLKNHKKLNENYYCRPDIELITLETKIAELLNQRDELLRYRNLTELDSQNCLKNITAEFLVSEICDLKSMVGALQKGLSMISDEHSAIKGLVINTLKDIDYLLEWNLNEVNYKNKYRYLENQEKFSTSRMKENSGFLLPKFLSSNQRLLDLHKPSSLLNHSTSRLFTTTSKISAFDSVENDSIAKFRQLAELKIMIDILQKYSKIVTDELRNLKVPLEEKQNPYDVETEIKTDHEDPKVISLIEKPENNGKPCHFYQTPDLKHKVDTYKNSMEVPEKDINKNASGCTEPKPKQDGTENQIEMPLNVHCISIYEKSGKNTKKLFTGNDDKCLRPGFEEKNSFDTINEKQKVCLPLYSLDQGDNKQSEKKVLFLSDGHGRNCSQFLQDELGSNFSVISVLKPDALFLELIEDYRHLTSSFTREDYVVIFAGSNNLKCKDPSQCKIQLEHIVPMFKHTNVIFTRMPLLLDQPSLNSEIRRVNNENFRKVHELAKKHSNILFMPRFTLFSRDEPKPAFNKAGKRSFCKLLAKTIMSDLHKKREKYTGLEHTSKPSTSTIPVDCVDVTISQVTNLAEDKKLSANKITDEMSGNKTNDEDTVKNMLQTHKTNQQPSKKEEHYYVTANKITDGMSENKANEKDTVKNMLQTHKTNQQPGKKEEHYYVTANKITDEMSKNKTNEKDTVKNMLQTHKTNQQPSKKEEHYYECSVNATISELLNFADNMKRYSNETAGETSENKEDAFDNIHQEHELNLQSRKSAQTQTSEENYYHCSCLYRITNYETLPFKLDFLSDVKSTSKTTNLADNVVETTKPNNQSTTTGEHFTVGEKIEDHRNNGNFQEHQNQGYFAGIFMKNNHQANMTTIKELLGQGDIPKPRKNFIQENVKRLKELKLEKTNKLGSQRNKNLQPLVRRNAGTMVSSSRLSGPPLSESPPPHGRRNKHVTLATQRAADDESPCGYRSQGCQTLSSKQLEHLYDEGVIRYPSVREGGGATRIMREMALQTDGDVPLEVIHAPQPQQTTTLSQDDGLHWDEERKEDRDYVKLNATVPDPRRHKTPEVPSTDPTRAPPTYQRGVVPKYLREHKKEMEQERMKKAKEEECPEGHIQLPDDIRQKHLATLRQKYEELVSQLNQLPVSTDTLRTRTRKKQIETDLDRIEAAIALFSREKVFVKADS